MSSKSDSLKDSNDELNDYDGSDWVKFTTKTWEVYRPEDRSEDTKQHPAKFPEELASDYIEFFTQEGECVFDPFAGVGTTVSVAENNNRQGVGVELNGEYVSIAQQRLSTHLPSEMVNSDVRDFISNAKNRGISFPDPMSEPQTPKFDFVFTSPPYWNVLNNSRGGADTDQKEREREGLDTSYSSREDDLGNIESYDTFIDELVDIFTEMKPLISDDGYIAIVTQNVRDESGEVKPISYDVGSKLSDTYTLKGERLWLQDDKQSAIWGYPTEYVSGKSHHIINIFKNEKS